MKIFSLMILLILPFTYAFSQDRPLVLRVSDYGWINGVFEPLRPLLNAYVQSVENDLNSQQPVRDTGRIMKATANSTALAARGSGLDYVNRMKTIMIGASLGAAADFDPNSGLKDEPITGLGGSASLLFGKTIDQRSDLFLNLGGVSHSRTFQGIRKTELDAEITAFSVGAHGRYLLVKSSNHWGGVSLNFGYDYIRNVLKFEDRLNEDLNIDLGGAAVLEGRLKGDPVYEIRTEVHSLPFELSTNYNVLDFLTLFAGTGADLNFGQSRGKGDLRARAFSPLTCVSGACTGLELPEVEVIGNLNTRRNVDLLTGRVFGGGQLSFGAAKIFGQVNHALGTKISGVNVGIKLVF